MLSPLVDRALSIVPAGRGDSRLGRLMATAILDFLYELPLLDAKRIDLAAVLFQGDLENWRKKPLRTRQPGRWEFHPISMYREGILVPRKSKSKFDASQGTHANRQEGTDLRFANVSIPDDAFHEIEAYLADMPSLCVQFLGITAQGASVLVKRKRNSDDWLAMVTFDDPYIEGQLCAITAWGTDPASAVAAFLYKWQVICGGVVPAPNNGGSSTRRRFG